MAANRERVPHLTMAGLLAEAGVEVSRETVRKVLRAAGVWVASGHPCRDHDGGDWRLPNDVLARIQGRPVEAVAYRLRVLGKAAKWNVRKAGTPADPEFLAAVAAEEARVATGVEGPGRPR